MKCTECPDYRECIRKHDLRRYRHRCSKSKEEKVFTNGDRYRSMSDEEMAETMAEVDVCPPRADRILCGDREGCKYCWLDHLRAPAEQAINDDDKELAAISAILESGKCPFPKKVCPKNYSCSRCIEETLKKPAEEAGNG